jgi:hypothetical protein
VKIFIVLPLAQADRGRGGGLSWEELPDPAP